MDSKTLLQKIYDIVWKHHEENNAPYDMKTLELLEELIALGTTEHWDQALLEEKLQDMEGNFR